MKPVAKTTTRFTTFDAMIVCWAPVVAGLVNYGLALLATR